MESPTESPGGRPGEEWHEVERVTRFQGIAGGFPQWAEGERAFLEQLPAQVERVADLGTGDGRLISLVHQAHPRAQAVGLDFSPPMLRAAHAKFDGRPGVRLIVHDLGVALPDIPRVDLVVSGFAIHHLANNRKRSLFSEIYALLEPGGTFLNLEHVASPSARLHAEFFRAVGERPEDEDPSDRLVAVCTQLGWLREQGFVEVDCHWKWRELALIGARRP